MSSAQKPMGASDTTAGTEAGSGFNFTVDFGSTGSGGGGAAGTSAAINTSYKIAQDKATAKRNRAQAEYIKGLLSGTGYRSAIDTLLGKVGEEETRQIGALDTQFAPAISNVKTAYETGTKQATAGYDALRNWLTQNAPTAYASATRAVASPIDNALQAYQRAQGVPTGRADAAVQLANLAATGGAGAGAPSGELPPLGAPTTGVGERNVPVVPEVPTTTAGGYVAGAQVSEVTIDKNTIVFPAGREARVRQAVSERQPVGGWRVGNIVDSYQGSGKNKGYEVRVVVVGVNPLRLRVERVKSSPPRTGTSAGAWT